MFNDQLQLASQWPRRASVERHDTGILIKQAICARCYSRRIALSRFSRANAQGFPRCDEGAPMPAQPHVYAEAAESRPNSARIAGGRAETIL